MRALFQGIRFSTLGSLRITSSLGSWNAPPCDDRLQSRLPLSPFPHRSLTNGRQWYLLETKQGFRGTRKLFGWASPGAPLARRDRIGDPYGWLRVGDEEKIKAHLDKENDYAKKVMKGSRGFEEILFREMSKRIADKEEGVPELIEGWHYYMRTAPGSAFPIYCRRRGEMSAPEEIVLDQGKLAQSEQYLMIPICKLSPCHTMVAYTADTTGMEQYSGHVREIATGKLLDSIENVVSVEWSGDGKTIFYTTPNVKRRPCKVFRRTVASFRQKGDDDDDQLVLQEDDEAYFLDVGKTKDKRLITFNCNSKTSSEVHVLEADNAWGVPRLIRPRRQGLEYFVEHIAGNIVIVTNHGSSPSYKLMHAPMNSTEDAWCDLYEPEDGVKVEDIDVFRNHIAVYERTSKGQRISIIGVEPHYESSSCPPTSKAFGLVQKSHSCGFPHVTVNDAADKCKGLQVVSVGVVSLPHSAGVCLHPGANCDFDATTLRVTSSTPVCPGIVYDVDIRTREVAVVEKRRPHKMKNFNEDDYTCEQHWAVSHDGVRIPMTVAQKRSVADRGAGPALLEVYGSYGQALETTWEVEKLSLLDRGWTIVWCHVRGGGELGEHWHLQGRGMNKKNSFLDTKACADYLVSAGIASSNLMVLYGASAGGLIVGAVLNMFPKLFAAAIAKVPFVDLANTMADPSLPLTAHEYDEWGDVRTKEVADYVLSYSPYDNIKPGQEYPSMMVTASFCDTRVGYWEPAKWVARLRELRAKGSGELVFMTSYDSGHFGEGGRLGRAAEISREFAWLHMVLGLAMR